MKTAVIIVAAGQGVRFKSSVPKPLVLLNGQPLIVHSLTVFERCINIDAIVIVVGKGLQDRFAKVIRPFKKVTAIVPGGATRAESVQCGLKALPIGMDYVLIHDAARPLFDKPMVQRVLKAFVDADAVITAVPAKSTVKEVDPKTNTVVRTLPRALMWEVQTPQGFKRELLEQAHRKVPGFEVTDDAMLVEKLRKPVKVVMGDYKNIKITTPEDLALAEVLLGCK